MRKFWNSSRLALARQQRPGREDLRSVEEQRQPKPYNSKPSTRDPNPTQERKLGKGKKEKRRNPDREKDRDLSSRSTSVVCCVKRDITVASPMALNPRS